MVAYIQDLAVRRKAWLSKASFRNGVAMCQSIPGATAMQAAAFVGLRAGGPWGALAAYAGFGLPAFIFMFLLSLVYIRASNLPAVISTFTGLHVIVVALVANATLSFSQTSVKSWRDLLLGAAAAAFLLAGGSPIAAIALAALAGLALYATEAPEPAAHHALSGDHLLRQLRAPLILLLIFGAALSVLFLTNRQLFDLSALMAKIDLFAFGGGYASVPLMFHQVVDVRGWMTSKTFMDGIALGQVTPGPIVITATFVGALLAGLPGAVAGTIAVFTPSLIILTAVVPTFDRFRHSAVFHRGLHGALVSFVGLLLAVSIQFALAVHWNLVEILIGAAAFAALRLKADILWVVLAGAAVSALLL